MTRQRDGQKCCIPHFSVELCGIWHIDEIDDYCTSCTTWHNKQIRSWVVTDKLHNEFVLCAMALVWLTPLKNGSPHMDYNLPCQIWSPLSHGMHVTRKNWVLASQLSGSLKVIWTNTDRSGTYSFLLLFHVNLGLSCTFSKILAKKLQIFSTHGYLMPRPRGSHLNFVMPHMLKKNRKMVLPGQEKNLMVS